MDHRDRTIAALDRRLAALEAEAAELRTASRPADQQAARPATVSDEGRDMSRRRLFRTAAGMAAGAGVVVLAKGSPAAAATAGNAVLGQANDANATTSLTPTGSAEPQGLLVVSDTTAKVGQLAAFGSVVGMGGAVTGTSFGRYGLYGQSSGPVSALFLQTTSDDVSLLQGTPSAGFPVSTSIPHYVGELNLLQNGSIATCVEAGSPGVWARVGFNPINPVRVVDSRPSGAGIVNVGFSGMQTGTARTITVGGANGIPASATAVAVNLTVAGASGAGYLRVWPGGASQPSTSNVNYATGQTVANSALVGLGTGGSAGSLAFVVVGTATHVVADITGYFI